MNESRSQERSGEVIVLGAGIAGLFAARSLSRAGWRVKVIERSNRCGGAHLSRNIGPYTFDIGSIMYEPRAQLFELVPGLRDLCPTVFRVQRRIAPSGDILHYPILPRELLTHRPERVPLGLLDLAMSRFAMRRDGSLEAILRRRLGRTFLKDTGLHNYITRFHHVAPETLDETFFYHRMAFVERATRPSALLQAVYRGLTSNKPAVTNDRRALHVRPREGYDILFSEVRRRLEEDGVQFLFGEELRSVRRHGERHQVLTSGGSHHSDAVISTVPIDTLHRALFNEPSGLISLNMTTLYVSAAEISAEAGNVLFNFHENGRWKRATIYSRIYPKNPTEREFFSVEVTIPPGGSHDPAGAMDDFRRHMESLGHARDMVLEGSELVEGCYPLYSIGSQTLVEAVLRRIAETGIIAAGRQGRFEYIPTASGVIRRVAEELAAAGILAGTGERLDGSERQSTEPPLTETA